MMKVGTAKTPRVSASMRLAARASLPSMPGSVHGGDNAFSEVVIDSLFKQKLPKLKP